MSKQCQAQGRRGPCKRHAVPDGRFCVYHREPDQGRKPRQIRGGPGPQPVERLFAPAVAESLAGLDHLEDADAAAVRLAHRYAEAIDSADDPREALALFGPKLRLTLESLGASPKGRAALKTGEKESNAGSGSLAQLRAARPG